MARVHLVAVHYCCAAELRRALESVAEDLAGSTRVERLTAWVVDNGRRPGESLLEPPLPLAPRLIEPGTNLGFGNGCNRALEQIQDGVVLLLNPDTRLLPGALDALLGALEHPGVGATGPLLFLDDALRFAVSEPLDLGLTWDLSAQLRRRMPFLGLQARALERRRDYVAGRKCQARMLCGACLAIPRGILDEVGLFHAGYFMYFEDLDLLTRIRKAGWKLEHVPAAKVVHYYDRSARQTGERKERWIEESKTLFLKRHYGPLRRVLVAALERLIARLPAPAAEPLGLCQDQSEPRRIHAARRPPWPPPWFFEFSEGPAYDITACATVDASPWEIPVPVWEGLVPKRYWLRLSPAAGRGKPLTGEMRKT